MQNCIQADKLIWRMGFLIVTLLNNKREILYHMVSKQKILIVDDDNNIAELISLYLTKECYET